MHGFLKGLNTKLNRDAVRISNRVVDYSFRVSHPDPSIQCFLLSLIKWSLVFIEGMEAWLSS